MNRKTTSSSARVSRRAVAAGLGATGILAGTAPFNILRAQGAALKVGVLLPRSGFQAGIGQDCQRGVDVDRRDPEGARLPRAPDHERRHRDQRRESRVRAPRS